MRLPMAKRARRSPKGEDGPLRVISDLNVKQPRRVSAASRRVRPSFARNSAAPRNEEGAGKAGHRLAPMVRVQQKSTRQNHRLSREYPAFPARMVLTVSFVLSPATSSFLSPSPRGLSCASDTGWAEYASTWLSISNGCQDHTTSPSATTSLVLRAANRSRVCLALRSPLARPTPSRPPHPALHVRDDRDTPL